VDELKMKISRLEEVIKSSQGVNTALEGENKSKEADLIKLKTEVSTVGNANIELQTQKISLESSMSDRETEIARLKKEKEDAAAEAADECAALMARIEAGSSQDAESMDFARQLQEQLTKKDAEITELHETVKRSQSEMHEVEAARNRLAQELEKETDNHAATTIERDTLMHEVSKGSSGVAAAQSIASADREKNDLLDEKISLQKEVSELKVLVAQQKAGPKQAGLNLDGASAAVSDHIGYLEMELVTTKINWAQAEEEKDLAWFKVRDVKKQLQKAHETNRSFAKRMTQLEVSLSTEKQKNMAARGVI